MIVSGGVRMVKLRGSSVTGHFETELKNLLLA